MTPEDGKSVLVLGDRCCWEALVCWGRDGAVRERQKWAEYWRSVELQIPLMVREKIIRAAVILSRKVEKGRLQERRAREYYHCLLKLGVLVKECMDEVPLIESLLKSRFNTSQRQLQTYVTAYNYYREANGIQRRLEIKNRQQLDASSAAAFSWQIMANGGHAENAETDIINKALESNMKEEVSKMNKVVDCFRKAVKELQNDYERAIDNKTFLYGVYWTEQDLVSDLISRIRSILKDEKDIEVHLNVCINKEFDYITKKGSKWLENRRKRFADIVILNRKNKEDGDNGPFSLVAEVKFSYRSKGQSIDKQVTEQIERDIERLKVLKDSGLSREVFFLYLDEYNKGGKRKTIKQEIKKKCDNVVRFYHIGREIDCDEYGRQK